MNILQEADKIINGERRESYGPAEKSFERIASVWSAILGVKVASEQVALCMIGMKLCREVNKPDRDNRVDIAGYTALLDRIHTSQTYASGRVEKEEEGSVFNGMKTVGKMVPEPCPFVPGPENMPRGKTRDEWERADRPGYGVGQAPG